MNNLLLITFCFTGLRILMFTNNIQIECYITVLHLLCLNSPLVLDAKSCTVVSLSELCLVCALPIFSMSWSCQWLQLHFWALWTCIFKRRWWFNYFLSLRTLLIMAPGLLCRPSLSQLNSKWHNKIWTFNVPLRKWVSIIWNSEQQYSILTL